MIHLSIRRIVSLLLIAVLTTVPAIAQARSKRSPKPTVRPAPISFTGPVVELPGAHITIRLPDRFTVKEKESATALISSPAADWALTCGSLGEAQTFDEGMVGLLSVLTKAFRPQSMSETPVQKLGNGMSAKQFTGAGAAPEGLVVWTAHIIQVKEKQFALTLAVFNTNAEGQKNLKKNLGVYVQIVSKIAALE